MKNVAGVCSRSSRSRKRGVGVSGPSSKVSAMRF
jgi:hypothetical protein